MTVWDRVFDPVGRPERPLAFLTTSSEDRNSSSPNPGILGFGFDQPGPNRVLTHVVHSVNEAVIGSQNMIEELLLPNWASTLEGHIDLSRRAAFDGLHDLRQGVTPVVVAAERGVDQMHVIWHDDGGVQIKLGAVLFDAALENNVA